MKRVIEAKKLGIFDDKVIEEQPKASHDIKKRIKTKPRKPIIEIDEDNLDQEHATPQPKIAAERQDSSSSIWSDNIPVITISKTYSDENILDKDQHQSLQDTNPKSEPRRVFVFSDNDDDSSSDEQNKKSLEATSFRPRVKCVLKKQAATAIDEDIIIHFSEDLERVEAEQQMILALANEKVAETVPSTSDQYLEPIMEGSPSKLEGGSASDRSTSDDTELKEDNSFDTILNSPFYAADGGGGEEGGSSSIENSAELEMIEGEEISLGIDVGCPAMKSGSRSQTESSSCYTE